MYTCTIECEITNVEGGMLAGHDQCGGELIERNGQKLKEFYGMSSKIAMEKHSGGLADYRASEGKAVAVPYRLDMSCRWVSIRLVCLVGGKFSVHRGDVADTARDILGGVRSTCTYVGASKLKELSKRTTFIRVTQQENRVFSNTSS